MATGNIWDWGKCRPSIGEITIDEHNYIITQDTDICRAQRNQINDLENKLKLRKHQVGG